MESRMNVGSANMLKGFQNLLFIFVDDDGAAPWTNELREPVEKKIKLALNWLEAKADYFGFSLQFQYLCLPSDHSIACHARRRIDESDYCAGPHHATWQNQVVAEMTRSGSVASLWNELFEVSGNSLSNSDGSAVFFIVRRWCSSVAFTFKEGQHTEFECERGIIYDNGGSDGQKFLVSLIAHEILHLYGAIDLAEHKISESIKSYSSVYSNDVMHTPTQRPIDQYDISDLTAYLVGWQQTIPACLMDVSDKKTLEESAAAAQGAEKAN